jgi:hypothetical protein
MTKVVKKVVTKKKQIPKKKIISKKLTTKRPVKKSVAKKTASKKKVTRKPASKKKTTKKIVKPQKSYENLLIENFVSLQKVMTNLSMKFSELSQNMSKVLFVFEEAAKNLAISEKVMNDQFGKKVDNLVDQNKTLNKNFGLMDERIRRQGRIPTHQSIPMNRSPVRQVPKAPEAKPSVTPKTENPQLKTPKSLPQI